MSLINQMLRDLEARRVEERGRPGWLGDLSPVRARTEASRWRAHWPGALLVLAALLFVGSGGVRLDGFAERALGALTGPGSPATPVSSEPAGQASTARFGHRAGPADRVRPRLLAARSSPAPAAEPLPEALPGPLTRASDPAPPARAETAPGLSRRRSPAAPTDGGTVAGAAVDLAEPVTRSLAASVAAPSPSVVSARGVGEAAVKPAPARGPAPADGLKLAYALTASPGPSDGLELPPALRAEAARINAALAAEPPAAIAPRSKPSSASAAASVGDVEPGSVRKRELPRSAEQRAETSYREALSALRAGLDDEGVAHLEAALDRWPGHVQAREVLAARLMRRGDLDAALALLEQGARLAPGHHGIAKLLARVLVEHGRLDEAVSVLVAAAPAPATDPEYHALHAATLQRAGRHAEAAEAYRAALSGRPRAGVWWMGLGISLEAAGDQADALEAFSRAMRAGDLRGDVRRFVESRIRALRG